ncbi:MAG: hypothetical protein NTW29_08385, partial [Bacteroidetes bacterium]|nr:hypothetical protein [Bacteroidota bacterium]
MGVAEGWGYKILFVFSSLRSITAMKNVHNIKANMYKVCFLLLSLVFFTNIIAQHTLPSIKATSSKVDVKIDQAYVYKGEWILEPDKKPDILTIDNKWPYDTKKVTFITDIDSVSIVVQPGHTYDFIIMLNERIPCYIQIATVPNPIFLAKKSVILILAGFVLFFCILYWNRSRLQNRLLLWCGYAVAVLFWLMTIISGQLHGNYNHSKNVISELGAIGTKSELFTSCFLLVLTILGILFSVGFYGMSKRLKQSVVPSVLSFIMPFTMVWAG